MHRRLLRTVLVALTATLLVSGMPVQASSVAAEQNTLVSIASSRVGSRFQLGAEGPTRFDCSGLVWYVYSNSGLADRIGSKRKRAREYQQWFRERGLLDAGRPKVGDLIFYGNPAKHTGLVTGFNARGKALITSALTNGVRQHRYDLFNVPRFHSYGHVSLGTGPDETPTPTPSPTPAPSATSTPGPTPTPSPTTTPAPTSTPTSTDAPAPSASPIP